MFEVTSHDFGTIARGAKAEFAGKITQAIVIHADSGEHVALPVHAVVECVQQ